MAIDPERTVYYKRARFTTRLPTEYRYTAAHFWLAEAEPGLWRVGLTRFATRMLGDIVEYDVCVRPGDPVTLGQPIGSLEGFKALSELYCVAEGEFAGPNPALEQDVSLVDSDPYDAGWLYAVRGRPEPASVPVAGYTAVLDATIDRMLKKTGTPEGAG